MMILALAILAATTAAVTIAAAGLDDASKHIYQCYGNDAEHYNCLNQR